jgi:hypothetical protein
MGERSKIRLALIFSVCLPICTLLMIVWHELVGHGLTAILTGGHLTLVDLFGVQIWPEFGKPGFLGRIDYKGSVVSRDVINVAGPLSTWCVSVLAVVLLWAKRWKRLMYVILVCLSLWWYDILADTLSIWGLPRGIWFHKGRFFLYSHGPVHYESAVRLGIPGSLFIIFSIGTSVCLLAGLVLCLIYDHKQRKKQQCRHSKK